MSPTNRRSPRLPVVLALASLATACASGSATPPSMLAEAPESMWRMLAESRVTPMRDAPLVAVTEVNVLTGAWEGSEAISKDLALEELIAAGMLRRRDVRYVERRRFVAAVEREDRGLPRAEGEPEAGVSAGATYLMSGSWSATGDSATLDLRLVRSATTEIVASWRATTPIDADPTSVARLAVGTLVEQLADRDMAPDWRDPVARGTPSTFVASNVPSDAVAAFLRGLEAEERFDWEAARRAYQGAIEIAGPGFFEPGAALARVARLRAGGTLGRND